MQESETNLEGVKNVMELKKAMEADLSFDRILFLNRISNDSSPKQFLDDSIAIYRRRDQKKLISRQCVAY